MATDVATLGMKIDSSDAVTAKENLDKLSGSAKTTGVSVDKMSAESKAALRDAAAMGQVFGQAIRDVIGKIVNMVGNVFDLGNELASMSQKTGVSVETLSKLRYVGEQMDVSLSDLGTAFKVMTIGIAQAAEGGGKAAEMFERIGINAEDLKSKKPDEAFLLIVERLSQIPNAYEQAEAGRAIFGKGFESMMPMLKEGPEKIRELMEEAEKLGLVMGGETAQASKDLGDTINKLQNAVLGLFLQAIAPILPALNELAARFVNAKSASGGNWVETLTNAFKFLISVGIVAWQTIEKVGIMIGATAAAAVAAASGNFRGALDIMTDALKQCDDIGNKAKEDLDALWSGTLGQGVTQAAKNVQQLGVAHKEVKKEIDQVVKAAQGMMDSMQKQIDLGSKATEVEKVLWEIEKGRLKGVSAAMSEQLLALAATLDAKEAEKEIEKQLADQAKERIANLTKETEELVKQLEKEQDHLDTMGLTKDQLELLSLAKLDAALASKEQALADALIYDSSPEIIAALTSQIATLKELITVKEQAYSKGIEIEAAKEMAKSAAEAEKSWLKTVSTIAASFSSFIVDWVNHGNDAFKNLWNNFKQWALQAIADVAAKQIVLSIGGTVDLGGGGGGAGGIGGLFNGVVGDMVKGLGSLLTGTMSLGTAFTNLSTIVPTFSTLLEGGATVAEAFSVAMSGTAASFGAVVPVVGAVIAAGTLIYNWLESKKGGPKEGGFATTGDTPGITGTDSTGRWMTPNNADPELLKSINSLSDQYKLLAHALGGVGDAVFALGYSIDPKGTAPGNVHSGVWSGGVQVYNGENPNVGRDPKEMEAALKLESMRMLLAALQSTELPSAVHSALMAVDVTTASIEAITEALEQAAAKKQMIDDMVNTLAGMPAELANALVEAVGVSPEIDADIAAFLQQVEDFREAQAQFNEAAEAFWTASNSVQDALNRDPKAEAMQAWADAHTTVYDKVQIAKTALMDATTAYDGTTQSTNDLADATNAYRDAQYDAFVQLQQVTSALMGPDGLFAQTEHTLNWALMSKSEQTDWLIAEAMQMVDLLRNTTDPAEIERLSRIINQDLTQAFNLMSPEEQRVQHDRIQGILDAAADIVDTQLAAAGEIIDDSTIAAGTTLGTVQQVLDAAGQKWNDAAQKMTDTADLLKIAAQAIVDAAADHKAAAATSAAAANTAAAAAETTANAASTNAAAANANVTAANINLEAANTPVSVDVYVNSGP